MVETNEVAVASGGVSQISHTVKLLPEVFVGHLILSISPKEFVWFNELQHLKEEDLGMK